MKIKKIAKLFLLIVLCEIMGSIGSIATYSSISGWYALLEKPFFNPPNWIFFPVWTILFALMGISLYLILEKKPKNKSVKKALLAFGGQFALNVLWSFLFFGLRTPFYAFIEILVLLLAIIITIHMFYNISKKAGLLLLPYLFWVSFATILNFFIFILN